MLGEAEVRFTGNLAADPELRFTPSGKAVCSFSVAVTGRKKDAAATQWEDGSLTYFRCTAWQQAENVAASLRKGDRVTVLGTISSREYEHNDEKRIAWEVTADEVAVSLRFVEATVKRADREPLAAVPA